MPGSYLKFKAEIGALIRSFPREWKGIDVGAGAGFWADVVGWGRMDALEVWEPYVGEFNLRQKYDKVFVGDLRNFEGWLDYNFAIIGDVLEHLSVEDAQHFLRDGLGLDGLGLRLIVAVPYLSPQEPSHGNPHEEHLQADLTPEVMAERYPELHLVIGDNQYGYYVNFDCPPIKPFAGPEIEHPLRPIPLVWWKGQKGYGDHGLLDAAFTGQLWPTPRLPITEQTALEVGNRGCLLVLPGRQHADQKALEELERFVEQRNWTSIFLTSDEENDLDLGRLDNGKTVARTQTPGPNSPARRFLPLGWRMNTLEIAREISMPLESERGLWAFSGQAGHSKRAECLDELFRLPSSLGGALKITPGFWQGMEYPDYLRLLSEARLCPSPSGPITPDCFRTWEALEMGSLPVVDRSSPSRSWPGEYYDRIFGTGDLIPSVGHWREFRALAEFARDGGAEFQLKSNRATSWWIDEKRRVFQNIVKDLFDVSGQTVPRIHLSDRVTVLMPMSPIPAHPSIEMIKENILKIRSYPDLERAEIVVMCDGVHRSLSHRAADYQEAIRRLLWWAQRECPGLRVLVFPNHSHQAIMTREALKTVSTPLVFFVEHDTFPMGEIEWERIARVVETGSDGVSVVRLQHYGGRIHPEHEWLLADKGVVEVAGLPVYKTRQWSQRPHLARTEWYRRILVDHFVAGRKTMIEDVMHGFAEGAPWDRYGLAVYAPPGNMQRSDTHDGRGTDPKIVEG